MADITAAMVKDLREMTGAAMMDCKKALVENNGDMEASKEFLRKKGQAMADKKSSRETKEGAIALAQNGDKAALIKIACETDFVAINDDFQAFIQGLADGALSKGVGNFAEDFRGELVGAIAKMGENMSFVEGVSWEAKAGHVIGGYLHGKGKIGVLVELQAGGDLNKAREVAKDLAMHAAACKVEALEESELDPAVLEHEKAFLIDQAKDSGKPMEIIEKMVLGRLQKFKKEICLLDQNFVKEPDKTVGGPLKATRFYKTSF